MTISFKRFLTIVLFGLVTSTIFVEMPALAAEDVSYLLTAASKGDVATVNAMLASGASPNAKDEDGITALMYAARKDKADVVLALINKGADINAKDNGGWTPLMFAAKKNNIASVKVLLDKGADPKVRVIPGASDLCVGCDRVFDAGGELDWQLLLEEVHRR